MRHWKSFLAKLKSLGRRQSIDRDLDREVASHLALLADDFERRGMAPRDARQVARRAFGSEGYAKEIAREAGSLVWLEQACQDVRHACRTLLHNPGFTLLAALTLALGIGVNAALFTAYNALALKPLPVSHADRVFRLERWFENGNVGNIQYGFSYPEYAYCRDHSDVFAGLVAASWPIRVVAGIRAGRSSATGTAETLTGELVSPNYFADLGIHAQLGRTILPDEKPADTPVMVLSDAFFQRRFSADPGILGQTVIMNGVPFTIAGVTPQDFTGTSVGLLVPDFWAPLASQKQLLPGDDWAHQPTLMQLQILGRLKQSVPLAGAQAQTGTLLRQFASAYRTLDPTKAVTLQHTSFLGNTEDPRFQAAVAALMLAVGLVLLAACANIANMLFARGVVRQREIAIRLALGASRRRVVRHLLTESLLLSMIAGVLGLLLSGWAGKLLWVLARRILAGPGTSSLIVSVNLSPDIRVFAYTALVSLLAAVLCGLAPALRSSRADLTAAIKDEGSLFGSRLSRSRLRAALVAGQVTVSTMLLITAGLLARGMLRSLTAVTGFETHQVLLVWGDFGSTPAKAAAMEHRALDRLRTLREVKSAALGHAPFLGTWTPPITVPGPGGAIRGRTLASYASDTYFDTLGIPLLRGRVFTRQEADDGAPIAVISNATARRYWPHADPLGKRLQLNMDFHGNLKEFEVVGIAQDVRFANLSRIDPAHVYLPAGAADSYPILVRIQGGRQAAAAAVRTSLAGLDKALGPAVNLVSLEDGPLRIQRSLLKVLAGLGAALASITILLAAAGIYGVMAFLVSQRVREIGIRIALGANAARVFHTVVVAGLRPVLAGIALGVFGAAGLSGALHSSLAFPGSSDLLYGVPFYDPITFLAASFLLIGVAAAASLFPARRALRLDPMAALRHQ